MIKTYLKIIGLSLLPTMLVYIGKSETTILWVQSKLGLFPNASKDTLMSICFFIGIFFSGLIIPCRLAYVEDKKKKLKENYLKTIENKKRIFLEAIKSELGQHNLHLNVRIFKKKKDLIARIKTKLDKTIEFEIFNIPGLAESGNTDGLKFQVSPICQGIVGFVYNERAMIYDDEIVEHNPKEAYNLNDFQMSKINGAKFVLGVPLFDSKNQVDVIITMDSEDVIKIDKTNKNNWELIATRYCQSMHHCVPILVN